jgi:protein-disulfide isomerase
MTSNTPRPTRSEQREAARAKAKAMREQQKKGDRRNRILIQLGIATSVLVVTGAVVFAVYSASTQSQATPVNATFNNGVKVGSELKLYTPSFAPPEAEQPPIEIVIYVDYGCPACAAFEIPNSDQIRSLVVSGAATLEMHPVSITGSPNNYPDRAANAAYCVADYSPDNFFDFNSSLFEIQPVRPASGGLVPGPDNSDLIALAELFGSTNIEKVSDCINSNEFGSFVRAATKFIQAEGVPDMNVEFTGTPSIFVNRQKYLNQGDWTNPAQFAQFIQLVAAGTAQ